ncbi:MAG: hypothetical protein KKC30_00035 [Proteobacteria bacterium]|nr:hypothetical protein [Pseudomonadota bacterium]MBU4383134.1 hypothetical protein [Pseudomonadota bacterium]MCG2762763.1 hypothetical protein [Desulfarculaceae bacterium]
MESLMIPEAARDHFNQEAEKIFGVMENVHVDTSPSQCFHPESHVDLELNEENIIDIEQLTLSDGFGNEYGLVFENSEGTKGFLEAHYREFTSFIGKIASHKAIRDRLSKNFISSVAIKWLKRKPIQEGGFYFTEYLESCAKPAIKEYEIWVPIEDMRAATTFQFGGMAFQTIRKRALDATFKQKVSKSKDMEGFDLKEMQISFDRQHRCKQGLTAATIKLCAEYDKARQVAMEKSILCTDILRSVWPSNMFSSGLCCWAPRGKTFIEKEDLYTIKDGIFYSDSRLVTANSFTIFLDESKLSILLRDLHEHHLMLVEPLGKKFTQEIIDAIRVYSRSSKTRYLDEKLIFIFASIESVLLKNGAEPISSFYDRFAFFVSKLPDERKQVSRLARKIYDYRSNFVHHGSTLSGAEREEVDRFLKYVWYFFLNLPARRHKFEKKEDLIEYLDDMKYYNFKTLF